MTLNINRTPIPSINVKTYQAKNTKVETNNLSSVIDNDIEDYASNTINYETSSSTDIAKAIIARVSGNVSDEKLSLLTFSIESIPISGREAVIETALFKYGSFNIGEVGINEIINYINEVQSNAEIKIEEKKVQNKNEMIRLQMDWATNIADDQSHGYSQTNRKGADYDCSSYVYYSLVSAGLLSDSGSPFTTYNMDEILTSAGFEKYSINDSTLEVGDILWRSTHTEIYYGNDQTIGAHGTDGRGSAATGDQGTEISTTSYSSNYDCFYRYNSDNITLSDDEVSSIYSQVLSEIK